MLGIDGVLNLIHVQSGGRVAADKANSWDVFVDDSGNLDPHCYAFTYVDWDTLVIMPQLVTFKGDSGKGLYLRATWIAGDYENLMYHQFIVEDGNQLGTTYEVQMQPDGHLRIKSRENNLFWRHSPDWIWIWADSSDIDGRNKDTLFWPVKVDDNVIALRNAGSNQFCKPVTKEGKTNCLGAAASCITNDTKLLVEELILERKIHNVRYRMEDARIFDERIKVVGFGEADNATDEKTTLATKVSFHKVSSHTFSSNATIKVGAKTSIKVGIPFIADGKIELSAEVSRSLVWSDTTTETETQEATYTTPIPPRSRAKINYLATQGTCSVPFSYTQKDKHSSDGSLVISQHIDGVYTGINYYRFHFDEPQFEPL